MRLMVALSLSLLLTAVKMEIPADFDPYKLLGVTRSASQAEIKKVYKRLVKEWHPDKNQHPEAEDMFIKITRSYELLTNEEKRFSYDRHGQHPYFHHSFDSFSRPDSSSEAGSDRRHTLHFQRFVDQVLPDSFSRPYLIRITSRRCLRCESVRPVWEETATQLQTLGMGVAVVDVDHDRRLANHLGAHQTPSILGLVSGRVSFCHYAVVKAHLMQFAEDLLPQRLVEKVTDSNSQEFLKSWRVLNKPGVLLFDQEPSAPLLFKLTAFAYKDYVHFGYVDQGLSETADLLRKFNINTYAPTMLVFKEDEEKPADIIQAKGMKKQIIDEFISNNRFLVAPRLVNQRVFEELCPVRQLRRRRRYCVLLISGEEESLVTANKAFLSLASADTHDALRFMFVSQRGQPDLCDALLKDRDAAPPQVVILERRSDAGKAVFWPVSGGWSGGAEDKRRLVEELERVMKDPSVLRLHAVLPRLNDELASMFFLRWIYMAYDYLSEIIDDLLHNNWREMMPLLSLIFSALFILFGTVVIQAFSDEEKLPKSKAKETETENGSPNTCKASSSRPPKKSFVEVTELTDITYTSNLVKLRPGHVNVVLVLTDATKNVLLSKFAKEVYSFTGSLTLHFSFLNVDKHSGWMSAVLEFAQDAVQIDADEDDAHRLDYTGYVLALNGHKKYLCVFRPVYTGDEPDEDTGGSRGRRAAARSRSTTLQIHHKLDRLGLWMERLMEGTLPRYYVPSWPGLDKITISK